MTTVNKRYQYFNGELNTQCEAFWKSTDADKQPTDGIPNGASGIEIDTGNFYFYDGQSKQWVFQFCLQAGGGE